jgi:hypothetical protein
MNKHFKSDLCGFCVDGDGHVFGRARFEKNEVQLTVTLDISRIFDEQT